MPSYDPTSKRYRDALGRFAKAQYRFNKALNRWQDQLGKIVNNQLKPIVEYKEKQKQFGRLGAEIADIKRGRMEGRAAMAIQTLVFKQGLTRKEAEARYENFYRQLIQRAKAPNKYGRPEPLSPPMRASKVGNWA
jgi:hypothetical protein